MGEFPSGQRGQTVNLLAVLSVVRIHLPPLATNKSHKDVYKRQLLDLRAGEVSGIPRVAVQCVDIRRNTSGEGG